MRTILFSLLYWYKIPKLLNVAIIDYGMGNLFSVARKLSGLGAMPYITNKASDLSRADKIILPGVGHFRQGMDHLHDLGLTDALHEHAVVKKKPVLGICLGMQLMADSSEEGEGKGLGWIQAHFARFRVEDTIRYKVPHTGWNQVDILRQSPLFEGIPDQSEFYFVHSYCCSIVAPEHILCQTSYSYPFVSAYQNENVFGVQFHPEKSHDNGLRLLENFIAL